MSPIEVTLDEDDDEVVACKRRKVEEEIGGKRVKQMSRLELEQLLETKILELLQFKGSHVNLGRRIDKLSEDNLRLKEKAATLSRQLADLTEVTRRVKLMEKENRGIRIPKITRNVGLQVNSRPLQEANTVSKKIDIGGAPEEILLDDDDCNSTEKADTSSITVQEPKNPISGLRKSSDGDLNWKNKRNIDSKGRSDYNRDNKDNNTSSNDVLIYEGKEIPDGTEFPLTLSVTKAGTNQGIVVQWAKARTSAGLSFDFSKVQLYELEGSQGGSTKWSKVGPSIRPLSLPMACNLNGFKTGITYNFRVKIKTSAAAHFSNVTTINL